MKALAGNRSWVVLLADATGAELIAARGIGPHAKRLASARVDYAADQFAANPHSVALEAFVAEHQLAGASAIIAFGGAGTIVQRLALPRLRSEQLRRAAATKFVNIAGGRSLQLDIALRERTGRGQELIAVAVDDALAHALYRACTLARLHVIAQTAVAGLAAPQAEAECVVQIVLGQRTTTLQAFRHGRLHSAREALLGRRDLVTAYTRPILSPSGPITLGAEAAEQLLETVGVPGQRSGPVAPSVNAENLWPLLNPVLQRLRQEVAQSLSLVSDAAEGAISVSVVASPPVPGLAAYIASELELRGERATHTGDLLHALSGEPPVRFDLRPPLVTKLTRIRPAVVAASVTALVALAMSLGDPQRAAAETSTLAPIATTLRDQIKIADAVRKRTLAEHTVMLNQVQHRRELEALIPPPIDPTGLLKALFATLPDGAAVEGVTIHATQQPATVALHVSYRGSTSASIVAAEWARSIGDSPFFGAARVGDVSGSGQSGPARIVLELEVRER